MNAIAWPRHRAGLAEIGFFDWRTQLSGADVQLFDAVGDFIENRL